MKTAIVIALAVISQAVGNTLLSKGMKTVSSMTASSDSFSPMTLVHAMGDPFIWGGTILLILFFACFLSALSWADLSFVIPATASGYLLNVFFGSHFLGESVSSARWLGSVLIFAGVTLVALSGRSGAKPEKGRERGEAGEEGMGC